MLEKVFINGDNVIITGERISCAVNSPPFQKWAAQLGPAHQVKSIYIQSVDLVGAAPPQDRVLFLKFRVEVINNGARESWIVFLGDNFTFNFRG